MPHYRELLNGAIDGAEVLRADFAPYLDRGVEALSPVEHGILLLATYELRHRTEIPYRVIINEAVELAKSFGGTEGFKYVNGVLDKVAAQLRATEVAARS
jgi:N utilization substance protein B